MSLRRAFAVPSSKSPRTGIERCIAEVQTEEAGEIDDKALDQVVGGGLASIPDGNVVKKPGTSSLIIDSIEEGFKTNSFCGDEWDKR